MEKNEVIIKNNRDVEFFHTLIEYKWVNDFVKVCPVEDIDRNNVEKNMTFEFFCENLTQFLKGTSKEKDLIELFKKVKGFFVHVPHFVGAKCIEAGCQKLWQFGDLYPILVPLTMKILVKYCDLSEERFRVYLDRSLFWSLNGRSKDEAFQLYFLMELLELLDENIHHTNEEKGRFKGHGETSAIIVKNVKEKKGPGRFSELILHIDRKENMVHHLEFHKYLSRTAFDRMEKFLRSSSQHAVKVNEVLNRRCLGWIGSGKRDRDRSENLGNDRKRIKLD